MSYVSQDLHFHRLSSPSNPPTLGGTEFIAVATSVMTLQGLILLIQSESLIRSRIFELLENKNFNIISSEDGLLGLRLAKEFQPDLIICDLNTPHNEGFTFFKKLRFILENLKIPCIFLISEAELDRYYHAQQLGVDDYLTKPIQNEQLLEAISRQFKKIQNQEVDCV